MSSEPENPSSSTATPPEESGEKISKKAAKKEAAKLEKLRRRQEKEEEEEASRKTASLSIEEESFSRNYGDVTLNELKSTEDPKAGKWREAVEGKEWTDVRELVEAMEGTEVLIRGRVHTYRHVSSKKGFLIVRQKGSKVQCVVAESKENHVSVDMVKFVRQLNRESFVDVIGYVVLPKDHVTGATQQVEIQVRKVYCVNSALQMLPLYVEDAARSEADIQAGKPGANQDTRLNFRVIDLRTPTNQGIFSIQSWIQIGWRECLLRKGFIEIHSPKLLAGSSEGGSAVFRLDYKGQPACLAQSPQLHKQMAICADFERVFEVGAVYRAEDSFTHRHLCEFIGLDVEMAIHKHYSEIMDLVGELFPFIFNKINENCQKELEAIRKQYPFQPLKFLPKTLKLTFAEGIQMLKEAGVQADPLGDLNTETERKLGELVREKYDTEFYILHRYPSAVRPFYTMPCADDPNYSNSFDVFIRGEEIISGAQRVHDPELLTEQAKRFGIDVETIKTYIDSFRYGAPPHGGFGVGLERVRTLSLAAAKSPSSTSPLSLRPLMAKLQCRTIQSFPALSSYSVVRIDKVVRNVCQLQFKRDNASCFNLACALPSISSVSYAAHWSSLTSFGSSFRTFPGRYFSQVPNTGNKDKVIRKFNKKRKKHEVLASSGVEAVVTSTEPVVGDVSSGIKVELSTAPSPAASIGKKVSTVKPKRRPKSKKVEDKSSPAVSVLEESLNAVPKPKGSGNRKSSSAKCSQKEVAKDPTVEEPKSSAPSKTEASNPTASKAKQASPVKTKRRPKSKKVDDKSSSAVPVTEEVSVEESSKSVPKPKRSGSGNRKSSSVKKEVAKSSSPSAKASNTPKQKQVPQAQPMQNSIEHRGQNASKPLFPPSGKSVIVVESITKAKVIQGYLGDMYEVLPSYGHIRDLASRSGSVRPDDDFSMVWEVPSSAWTHIKSIKMALNGAENLILASDPDREGEAIAWHIIEMLQQQGALHESMTVARVVFHEITESAIKTALQSPREIDGDLVHAYLARRALDYLIGFNISPLLWRKLPGCPSAGRVQSAALALICDRESEIDGFKPQEYWTVGIKVQGKDSSSTVSAHLTSLNSKKLNQLSISSEADAQDIEQRIRSEGFLVKSIKKSTTRRNPPTPYITSTLQQDAANKLHFSSAYTMKLAQKLYEGVQLSDGKSTGLITYMRTDGLHIADEAIKDIQSLVVERYGESFTSDGPRKYFKKVKNAQEAHEAIRPTNIRRLPSTIASLLDSDSLKLYTLIWSRSVACQMEPASVVQIQVDIGNASESIIFRSSCSKVDFLGYQAVYEDPETKTIKTKDDEKSSEREETFETLSLLKDWDPLHIGEVELKQHHTQPPPRYSEGSLIKKLEELGIGRPSTYASIFKVLQDRKYLTIKSRVLYPEFRGRMVSAFLTNYFTEVTDYSFTADMETELDNVSGGVTNWKGLLRDYWTRFSAYCKRVENVQIQQVEKMLEKKYEDFLFSSLPDPTRTCPSCSEGTLIFKVSKFGTGYFIGCDGYPSCKFIAKTLYGEDEDEDDSPRNTCVEEPKLLGLHPNTNEKVILKCGPYGYYVQLGEDKKGHLPKRANAAHIKDVSSITLESALELLRYPLTLGTHPEDGQPVTLKLSKSGFTVRHRRTMATVPKNTEPSEVTLEKALKLLSGKNVRLCGRPKRIKPTVDEESEGDEVVETM
ncbi:unnamed protein product [Brassica oleracea]